MNPKILPTGLIIKKTIRLVFDRRYLPSFLAFGTIMSLVAFLSNFIVSYLSSSADILPPLLLIIGLPVLLIVYVLFYLFLVNLSYLFANRVSLEQAIDIKPLLAFAYKNLFPFAKTSLLYGLIIVGGSCLLFIPGIIWGIWYFFAPMITSLDGLKGKEALLASKSLVKGRFWGVFLRIILFYVVSNLPGFVLTSIFPQANYLQTFFVPISSLIYLIFFNHLKAIRVG